MKRGRETVSASSAGSGSVVRATIEELMMSRSRLPCILLILMVSACASPSGDLQRAELLLDWKAKK